VSMSHPTNQIEIMTRRFSGARRTPTHLSLPVPGGTVLVTGFRAEQPITLPIALDLPVNFTGGQTHTVHICDRPVQISLKKVQDV
jgi:hypothetical protein